MSKAASWKRPLAERMKSTFGTNPLPPAQTPASQLPTPDSQIRLNLDENVSMIYENGRWITGSVTIFVIRTFLSPIHMLHIKIVQAVIMLDFNKKSGN